MERVYHIGDYYDDGVKQGVVIAVDADGLHGKILSLQQHHCSWAVGLEAECSEIRSYDKRDGAKNQAVAMGQENWQERYPAFAFCASLGEGWYLPTLAELRDFTVDNLPVLKAINERLSQIGVPIIKGEYWTSNECGYFDYDDEYLVAMVLIEEFKRPWINRVRETEKGAEGYARAVARF